MFTKKKLVNHRVKKLIKSHITADRYEKAHNFLGSGKFLMFVTICERLDTKDAPVRGSPKSFRGVLTALRPEIIPLLYA